MVDVEYPLMWRQETIDKIWRKHRVCAEEVNEAVFDDRPIWTKGRRRTRLILGRSVSGRYLFIVVVKRAGKGRYEVLTAREMMENEKRRYRKHFGGRL